MRDLATRSDLHPKHIQQWKDKLIDMVACVFDDKPKAAKEPEMDVTSLHSDIGKITLEN